jgi:hypothetical protein
MTLWARKSGFQETFGENWTVELNELEDKVEFIIMPNENITIDIDSMEFRNLINYMTGLGEDEAKIFYDNDNQFGFQVVVPRTSLPEDYTDKIY